MKRKVIAGILVLVIALLFAPALQAQCIMCKEIAEQGAQDGQTTSAGLNFGILYLLTMPYLSFMVIGFLWWRHYRKRKAERAELGID